MRRSPRRRSRPHAPRARQRIAIHEAGHAVMAYAHGRRLGAMSAIPHGDVLGELEYRGYSAFATGALASSRARRKVEAEILIAMAGLAAEEVHARPANRPGAVMDLHRALEVAMAATGDAEEATALVNWLFVRARNLLRTPSARRAVKSLAHALARRGTLTGSEVRTALRAQLGS